MNAQIKPDEESELTRLIREARESALAFMQIYHQHNSRLGIINDALGLPQSTLRLAYLPNLDDLTDDWLAEDPDEDWIGLL